MQVAANLVLLLGGWAAQASQMHKSAKRAGIFCRQLASRRRMAPQLATVLPEARSLRHCRTSQTGVLLIRSQGSTLAWTEQRRLWYGLLNPFKVWCLCWEARQASQVVQQDYSSDSERRARFSHPRTICRTPDCPFLCAVSS